MSENKDDILSKMLEMKALAEEFEKVKETNKDDRWELMATIMSKFPQEQRPSTVELILTELKLMNQNMSDIKHLLVHNLAKNPIPKVLSLPSRDDKPKKPNKMWEAIKEVENLKHSVRNGDDLGPKYEKESQ